MKNGTYKVSFLVEFEVELTGYSNEEEASVAVQGMVKNALDEDNFPEVNFELIEELDPEYNTEEDEVEELCFEESA
jgi:hypothetical protein